MKKHIRSFLIGLCCIVLALSVGCGGLTGGPTGSPPEGPGKPAGGEPIDGMLSVRDDIEELGDNVDNVPYIGATESEGNGNNAKPASYYFTDGQPALTKLSSKEEISMDKQPMPSGPSTEDWGKDIRYSIDVETPEDDIYYNDYAESRAYVAPCGELFYIGQANSVLDFDVKYVKENVFQNVTMLNRWIRHTEHSMLRMRYDQVNNVLSCEELMAYEGEEGPYFHYHCTTSSYTSDGKKIIEFITTRQRSIGDYKYSAFYRYIEDKEQLYFTVHDENMYGVVYSDLSQENPLVTAFTYSKDIAQGEHGGVYEEIVKEIYLPQTETDCGFAASITDRTLNGEPDYSGFQQVIINSHGLNIGYINEVVVEDYETQTVKVGADMGINLPYITNLDYSISFKDGIDFARLEGDPEYRDTIFRHEYISENVTYHFNLDGVEFTSRDDTSSMPFTVSAGLLNSLGLGVYVENEEDLLSSIQNSGIVYEQMCMDQVERFLERDEFLASHSMYGYTLDTVMTPEIIHDIFMNYVGTFSHVSDEELQSYDVADALPMDEQTVDELYYAIYDVRFDGTIAFDGETKEIDVSGITATMSENLALDGGETLALVAVYSTGCDSFELLRNTFVYEGEELTMTFEEKASVSIPDANGEGQITFFVINTDNQSLRISEVYTPACEGEVDTLIVSTTLIKRVYIVDGKLVARQADAYTVSTLVEENVVSSPVRFVQSVSAFIEGDYAVVTVMDGENEVGQFEYDFDVNVDPDSIALENGANADNLMYTLSVYNANGDVIYTEILQSGNSVVTE